jgi:acylphosphatase
MQTVQLKIKGKVQGVFYRVNARDVALSLGIRGWVKNAKDGSVVILAEGTESALAKFRTWCWQGPTEAKVDDIEEEVLKVNVIEEGFRVIREQ